MTEQLFLWILVIHFLADFGLQTHEQATMKGKFNLWLFYHVGVYSVIWLICSFIFFGEIWDAVLFSLITFIFHYCTDWITSRIGKPFWEKQDLHNGFVVVGFDQVLHYIQLYYTFKYIINL